MAGPNYLAYAQYMGARNPTADTLNQIGGTLDDMQKNKIQREELGRRNRLSDLQMQQGRMQLEDMQEERTYRQGLKAAMANPATTTSIAPDRMTPQEGVQTLASALPNALPTGQPQEFAMTPEPVSPTVGAYSEGRVSSRTETPAQAGMKYAASEGRFEDLSKLMTVDDLMGKYAAHILTTGGDPVAYQQAVALRAEGKELAEVIAKFKDNPELLQAAWPAIQKGYPGAATINPESISIRKDGTVLMPLLMNGKPVEGKGVYYDKNDIEHIVDTTPKAENEEQLTARALKGDKSAQAILDAMQNRKVRIAKESRPIINNTGNKMDPIIAREAIKDLPKLRKEANTAVAAKSRLDQMIALVDKGSAGGLKGNVLNAVAGVFDVPATSEADLFKKLAGAGAGQLRSTVIGPGQVSNYEQKLLQSVSGGGSGARTAVKNLLLFYKEESDRTINNYNDAVESASTVVPNAKKAFRPIGGAAKQGASKDPLGIL